MSKKLFIGSLAWETNDESLKNFFSQVGTVESARVIFDRATGRSKGFGFVEFANEEDAKTAMQELEGKELDGRPIRISEANAQEERGPKRF
jgi:cold-inducible RNA-binding protein